MNIETNTFSCTLPFAVCQWNVIRHSLFLSFYYPSRIYITTAANLTFKARETSIHTLSSHCCVCMWAGAHMQYNIWETAPTFITTGSSQSPTHFGKKTQAPFSLAMLCVLWDFSSDFSLEGSVLCYSKNAKGKSTFGYFKVVLCHFGKNVNKKEPCMFATLASHNVIYRTATVSNRSPSPWTPRLPLVRQTDNPAPKRTLLVESITVKSDRTPHCNSGYTF